MNGDLDDIDVTLVVRYLGDDCTPTERAHIEHWMAADPGRAAYVESLREIRDTWAARRPRFDQVSGWAAMAHRLSLKDSVAAQRPAAVFHRARPRRVGGGATWLWVRLPAVGARAARPQSFVAAMVIVTLGVGLAVIAARHRAPTALSAREYATVTGQRLSVTLVDGTQLTLAPASRVHVAADYGRGRAGRDVELEGEAYFTVIHDATHPFAVRAHGLVVQDVGTAFDVRAYPEDAGARVAVADGRVSLVRRGGLLAARGAESVAALGAGDVATVSKEAVTVGHGADVAELTAWMQGRLVFRATPLGDVVRQVARMFDLEITVADSGLADQRITAAFADEPVDEILDGISGIVGGRYERTGRTVVIRRRVAGAHRSAPGARQPLTTAQAMDRGR